MTCDAYCEGCYYYGPGHKTCDYWEKADELRGCPPGKGCTRKITKKEYMRIATQKSWNKAAGYEMFKAGKSDKEIGEALGVTAAAVSYYRKRYWDKCVKANKKTELVPAALEEEIPDQLVTCDEIEPDLVCEEIAEPEMAATDAGDPCQEQTADDHPAPLRRTRKKPS